MKNLQQAIEEIVNRNIQFEVNFERADDPTGDIVYKEDLIKELTQLITSREGKLSGVINHRENLQNGGSTPPPPSMERLKLDIFSMVSGMGVLTPLGENEFSRWLNNRFSDCVEEQEIREEAVRDFLDWYSKNYPDGVWLSEAMIIGEYLAQQKENK